MDSRRTTPTSSVPWIEVKEEVGKVIDLVLYIFKTVDFQDFIAQVSLRDPENPGKYIGSDENWDKAEKAIAEVAVEKGLKTVTELGEAAFYGPKLDFMVRDAIGRKWQLGTVRSTTTCRSGSSSNTWGPTTRSTVR